MTVRKLSKLYYLKKLIERDQTKLKEIELRLEPGGMNMTGMPHGPTSKNMIEELMPVMIEMQEKIKEEWREYIAEKKIIEDYISTVDDYHVRYILLARFVDLMKWPEIAQKLGGNNTEDSVKKMCYRFLENSEKK